MPNPHDPGPSRRQRSWTLIAAGLLIAALALVVLYTQRVAFLSPVALVVIAAIGVAALLLQLRLRPDLLRSGTGSTRGPLWLHAFGVGFAIAAVIGDMIHLSDTFMLMAALAAVACFAVSGIIVLSALRKRRA
jgi:predicted MFS family arabinose efflux permease